MQFFNDNFTQMIRLKIFLYRLITSINTLLELFKNKNVVLDDV